MPPLRGFLFFLGVGFYKDVAPGGAGGDSRAFTGIAVPGLTVMATPPPAP